MLQCIYVPNTVCTAGQFGDGCNGTCHCLDADACDHVTGLCVGKCQKGFYKPPQCQDGKFVWPLSKCQKGFYKPPVPGR